MFVHFDFYGGTNPYITFSDDALFGMFKAYHCIQIGESAFYAAAPRAGRCATYRDKKELAREIAQKWQSDSAVFGYSYGELANWQGFFETIGRKYGLLREFSENGIC